MSLPDFGNRDVFPSFAECPEADLDVQRREAWFLIAQIKDDMTITKPTLILEDRDGSPFAVVFEGFGHDNLYLKKRGLKKGCTAVLPRARRTPPKGEGKRGFVSVEKSSAEDVKAIRGKLEDVKLVVETLAKRTEFKEAEHKEVCECCGKKGDVGSMKKCMGCGEVLYCGKDCQLKDWSEGRHKDHCKIIKAVLETWS